VKQANRSLQFYDILRLCHVTLQLGYSGFSYHNKKLMVSLLKIFCLEYAQLVWVVVSKQGEQWQLMSI